MIFEIMEKHFVKIDNEYCGGNDETKCEYDNGKYVYTQHCDRFNKELKKHFVSNRDPGRSLRCDECKKLFSNSDENSPVNRWEVFQKSYDQSIESIHWALENTETHEWELECKHLMKWLFETEHNPYGIFGTKTYTGESMRYAEGFASLCSMIHHAICDDGDICYPVVNGSPSIYFGWEHDEDIETKLIHEDVFLVKLRKQFDIYEPPTLTFLKNAYEFTNAFDEYEELQSKRYEELENRRWEEGEKK